jgi:hypothetical protein
MLCACGLGLAIQIEDPPPICPDLVSDRDTYRAPLSMPDIFFAARSWAGCITNMSGFDLRQAQVDLTDMTLDRQLRE